MELSVSDTSKLKKLKEFLFFESQISKHRLGIDAIEQFSKVINSTPYTGMAPNGIPSNLNEIQWILVRTEAFKDWFGEWEDGSAKHCLDENGEPLIVHHGGHGIATAETFSDAFAGENTCNNESGAFHFVDELEVAKDYGRQSFIRKYQDCPNKLIDDGLVPNKEFLEEVNAYSSYNFVTEKAEDNIEWQSVFLKMKNPIMLDMEGDMVDVGHLEKLRNFIKTKEDPDCEFYEYVKEVYDEDDIIAFKDEINEYLEDEFLLESAEPEDYQLKEAISAVLMDNGYYPKLIYPDGIIVTNMIDSISEQSNIIANQFIVFNADQIGFRQH